MARGWESKSIEEQQSEVRQQSVPQPQQTPEQIEGRCKRDGLILSRKNAEAQLSRATNPAHRQMLERALADLDREIARLAKFPG